MIARGSLYIIVFPVKKTLLWRPTCPTSHFSDSPVVRQNNCNHASNPDNNNSFVGQLGCRTTGCLTAAQPTGGALSDRFLILLPAAYIYILFFKKPTHHGDSKTISWGAFLGSLYGNRLQRFFNNPFPILLPVAHF